MNEREQRAAKIGIGLATSIALALVARDRVDILRAMDTDADFFDLAADCLLCHALALHGASPEQITVTFDHLVDLICTACPAREGH